MGPSDAPHLAARESAEVTQQGSVVSEQDNNNSSYGGSEHSAQATPTPRRTNVRSACQSCRGRKLKCNGGLPCSRCLSLQVSCVYAPDLDRRTSAAIKRKFEAYEHGQRFLHELLDSIRHSSDEQVNQVLSLIRANASFEEIRMCMSQQVVDLRRENKEPSPDLVAVQEEFSRLDRRRSDASLPRDRRGVLQIARLVDEPPHRAPAAPWTSVTDDDHVVSNLISVWLTWDYLIYNWMDAQAFLRDMQRAQLDSPYCSPFLVNCILAWACPYSDWPEARSVRGQTSKLLHEFLEEAKRLLEWEVAQGPSLTLLQGLMFLFLILSLNGQDRLGYQYLVQAIDLVNRLPKTPIKKLSTPKSDPDELIRAIDHTCWGVYNTVVATFMALIRPCSLKAPPKSRTNLDSRVPEFPWTSYPQQSNETHSHLGELFNYLCKFSELIGSINRLIFAAEDDDDDDDDDDDNDNDNDNNNNNNDSNNGSGHGNTLMAIRREEAIVEIYLQIVRQHADLPYHLQPIRGAPPSAYMHHLWMNAELLSVLLYLRQDKSCSSPSIRSLALQHSFEIALRCAHICRYYMDTFSNSLISNCATQGISMSLYILIEDAVDIGQYDEEVTDLCIMLHALSHRWPLSMGILRMVQLKARELKVQLPPSTDKLFDDFRDIDWQERDRQVFTQYPDPDSTMSKTEEVVDMKEFFDRVGKVDLRN